MIKNTIVALADDHIILRNGLAGLLTKLGYQVLFESNNGNDVVQTIGKGSIPDVILMDINMPEMDGFETTLFLKKNYPSVKVLALSMYDDENSIIRMLRNGACGYLLKDVKPTVLKEAIDSVMLRGFYYSEMVTGRLMHSIHHIDEPENSTRQMLTLSDREIKFLKLASTELTYKEIAEEMHVSPRTVDGYRDSLFEKLNVKSRVGLVLFAIKKGIVQIN
jgi:DNA-binding NarL/FixJ family response regulator